ncbi:DeoR/GlpR family DNA-binding transcription regulator [Sporosarcina sp. ACRSL]|uniref:DeoR/GlpR family DNA-binding transcription regulator n=1 Tax=Sporosarcina sp. ACRSL TaxID=2918215 RepID=UPI001EF61133|nr:DeoR/GlpR family DNA-binding transcription regulator [Sporosarcina sp. ACRSL]MCG7344832.1 DeoR/GlpR family DNA-binding transcription regulator [Sporosarcina sp. ACRSL]
MLPRERKKHILQLLEMYGKIDIVELSNELSVTPMTIRRDLDALEKERKLIRTHGGAVLPQGLIFEETYESKAGQAVEQKRLIAMEASSLIKENMTILLDSGTTTLEIAKILKHRENLTVITTDIKIAVELMNSKLDIIVVGGRLQNDVGALYGSLTELTLSEMHADLFFLGAHAVHPTLGVTTPSLEKAAVKKAMIQAAEKTFLVADSSKFNRKAFSKVCELTSLTKIITDQQISIKVVDEYAQYTELIIAK